MSGVEGKQHSLEAQLCEALGLENVVSLTLDFAVDEIAKATVIYYPDKKRFGNAVPIIKQYKLVPKE